MARNDVYLNINALSPADAVVTGQQDMTAATVPELVLGDTPTFNFLFTDNTNVWPSWAGNAAYTVTWALSDAVSGDFSPAATTGNATPITGGWSIVLPLNAYDLVGLLNTKRVSQPYPVTNLWQQLRVTDPSGNEVTRAMFWTPVRYRAISDTQNTESASPTGGRFVTVNNVNVLTTPTAAQFYAANPVPTSALGTAANGELLIGNGTGFTKSTLTAGTGITVTNGSGSITIDATGAQETLTATVKNAESIAITKGQVVYLFGATGGFASVKLAYNTSDATSAKTFGVVSDTSIAPNGTGTVTCVGVVDGLNLGAYQDGDTVYLGATPGSFTATKPYAPNHLVYVGIVERANAGNGELYVRVQNGYELDEIHDVQINAPKLAGQTLIYDETNDLWKNARLTGTANQITVTNADAAVTVSIPTNPTLPGNLTVSGTTDSSSKDTGAIVTEGGLGVEKSATIGGNLTVSGTGTHTFGTTNTVTIAAGNLTASGDAGGAGGHVITSADYGTSGVKNGFQLTASNTTNTSSRNWALLQNVSAYGDLQIIQSNAYGGSPITAGTAALSFNASRNATLAGNLTVSGTGTSSVAGNLQIGGAPNIAPSTIDRYSSVTVTNVADFPAFLLSVADGSKNVRGSMYIDSSTTEEQFAWDFSYSSALYPQYKWKIAGTTLATLRNNGNFILSSTGTDSGNGKVQLADHTTSAGGIGFGTDTTLYRTATGNLVFGTSGTALLFLQNAGSGIYLNSTGGSFAAGMIESSSGLILRAGSATALTLDSSQNATFSGTVIANKATTAFRIPTAETPASASATGTVGTITWDASYIYVCTAANTWKRVAIATW